ncbi:MAG TPA: 50S ribosomal protein L15 [Tepidiformaceae bacterium]|nr:50S ribosomal protein L15 [Tepidiformaceae bacterium]HNO64741.1 50S ribosomal protein L15 [Tepidiformaceae bacterium]
MGAQDLRPSRGATHSKKRVGRGNGSGNGTYAGKGLKGQKSRSGKNLPYDAFEGGQFPSSRKFHVLRGFNNKWRVEFQPVNLAALERFEDGSTVSPESLRAAGVLRNLNSPVKILGNGTLTRKLTVSAHRFSESARTKIEAAGGVCTVIAAEESKED